MRPPSTETVSSYPPAREGRRDGLSVFVWSDPRGPRPMKCDPLGLRTTDFRARKERPPSRDRSPFSSKATISPNFVQHGHGAAVDQWGSPLSPWRARSSPPSGAKHDRSAGAAPGCCREGRGGLLERERRRDRDLELPGREQLGELAERAAVGLHDHRRDRDAPLLVRWVLGDRRKVTAVAHGADRVG